MAKSDCVTCGRTLYFSHPTLEAKGLFSPAWGAYLEHRYGKIGMRCLRCIGTKNCVSCGQTLGDPGSVAGDKDGERSCFCGTEFCVDCVKKEIRNKSRSGNSARRKSAVFTFFTFVGVSIAAFILQFAVMAFASSILQSNTTRSIGISISRKPNSPRTIEQSTVFEKMSQNGFFENDGLLLLLYWILLILVLRNVRLVIRNAAYFGTLAGSMLWFFAI